MRGRREKNSIYRHLVAILAVCAPLLPFAWYSRNWLHKKVTVMFSTQVGYGSDPA